MKTQKTLNAPKTFEHREHSRLFLVTLLSDKEQKEHGIAVLPEMSQYLVKMTCLELLDIFIDSF